MSEEGPKLRQSLTAKSKPPASQLQPPQLLEQQPHTEAMSHATLPNGSTTMQLLAGQQAEPHTTTQNPVAAAAQPT
jgi:hypothetical protein